MDPPPLWLIARLGSGPKTQISTNISRRIPKTSSICIKTRIGKNDVFLQLSDVTNRAFHTPG